MGRVICQRCHKVIRDNVPGLDGDSHGPCPDCHAGELLGLNAWLKTGDTLLSSGLAIAGCWPQLARRVGDAMRLVESGCVWANGRDSYIVQSLAYHPRSARLGLFAQPHIIDPATVRKGDSGYWCDCRDFENGIVGWHLPYPPRVEFTPGHTGPVCCHVLAVHLALMVAGVNSEIPFMGEPMYPPERIAENE